MLCIVLSKHKQFDQYVPHKSLNAIVMSGEKAWDWFAVKQHHKRLFSLPSVFLPKEPTKISKWLGQLFLHSNSSRNCHFHSSTDHMKKTPSVKESHHKNINQMKSCLVKYCFYKCQIFWSSLLSFQQQTSGMFHAVRWACGHCWGHEAKQTTMHKKSDHRACARNTLSMAHI